MTTDDTVEVTVLVGEIRGDAIELTPTEAGDPDWFPLSLIDHTQADLERLDGSVTELDLARWKARDLGWVE